MHRKQILGPAIRHLRRISAAGASPEDLEAFLKMRSGDLETFLPTEYLGWAFQQQSNMFIYSASLDQERTNVAWGRLIAEHRDEWQRAPIPELMRLRDYFAFMQFAQQEQVSVIVCAANPAAGAWIGQPGVRCYEGSLPILSRITGPNEGLLAADPNDARLLAMLQKFEPPLSYGEYVGRLAERNLRVGSQGGGYLVEDEQRSRLHEAYRLHGVYDSKSDEPAWTPKRGEPLRAALNRHLGSELVWFGPHDEWELRTDQRTAGPYFGPLLPVVAFDNDQRIDERSTLKKLARLEPYRLRWDELYPHHPIKKQG